MGAMSAVALDFSSVFKFLTPRRPSAGVSSSPSFRAGSANSVLSLPTYRDHLTDIFSERSTQTDARSLLELMFRSDPDVTAAVNAYLTVANTEPMFFVRDVNGVFSRDAYKTLNQILLLLGHQTDNSKGWERKRSLERVCEDFRYLLLLRGGIATELVYDKALAPSEIRNIDVATVKYYERVSNKFEPVQVPVGQSQEIPLSIPTFFAANFRTSPLSVYPTPPFVSAINTIAARQQVINDLYRIMNVTGFPRMDVTVLEAVLRNAAPASLNNSPTELNAWIEARIGEVRTSFAGIRPDQSLIHTDSVKVEMLNERAAASGINIEPVINVLNGQNQAGLKTVSTILGRGESGVNTASVESRVFALNADALNGPVAEVLSGVLSLALQIAGHPVFVKVKFRPSELRPTTELEPHLVMRQSRLLDALSLGTITDEEFHIEMYGRLPPEGAPVLMGTGFRDATQSSAQVDVENISPNADPMGRSLAPSGGRAARSKAVR